MGMDGSVVEQIISHVKGPIPIGFFSVLNIKLLNTLTKISYYL